MALLKITVKRVAVGQKFWLDAESLEEHQTAWLQSPLITSKSIPEERATSMWQYPEKVNREATQVNYWLGFELWGHEVSERPLEGVMEMADDVGLFDGLEIDPEEAFTYYVEHAETKVKEQYAHWNEPLPEYWVVDLYEHWTYWSSTDYYGEFDCGCEPQGFVSLITMRVNKGEEDGRE